MPGGNTDELYRDGRREFAESLALQHPDVARVVWRYGRDHHQVDYSQFRYNEPLPKRNDVLVPVKSQEYGMELVPNAPPPSRLPFPSKWISKHGKRLSKTSNDHLKCKFRPKATSPSPETPPRATSPSSETPAKATSPSSETPAKATSSPPETPSKATSSPPETPSKATSSSPETPPKATSSLYEAHNTYTPFDIDNASATQPTVETDVPLWTAAAWEEHARQIVSTFLLKHGRSTQSRKPLPSKFVDAEQFELAKDIKGCARNEHDGGRVLPANERFFYRNKMGMLTHCRGCKSKTSLEWQRRKLPKPATKLP